MKLASDFRRIARDALKGNWAIAVGAGFIASVLGGLSSSGGVNFEIELPVGEEGAGEVSGFFDALGDAMLTVLPILIISTIGSMLLMYLLGSVISVGYSRFNLGLVDLEKPDFGHLFGYFKHWGSAVGAYILRDIYVFLWSLLFVIPGIIASYSYAMTGYILADNPGMRASDALARSKELMRGNRWRLFCLQFSFIGWEFLCVFTLGIGMLWLTPYIQASTAAFYRELVGSKYSERENDPTYLGDEL